MVFTGRQSCQMGGKTREATPLLRAGPPSSPPFRPRCSSRPATRCPGPGRPPPPTPVLGGVGTPGPAGLAPLPPSTPSQPLPETAPLAPILDKPERRTRGCPEHTRLLPRPCPSGGTCSRSRPPRLLVIRHPGEPCPGWPSPRVAPQPPTSTQIPPRGAHDPFSQQRLQDSSARGLVGVSAFPALTAPRPHAGHALGSRPGSGPQLVLPARSVLGGVHC